MAGFQYRVAAAHDALFHDDPTDVAERNARALEEALETAQAFGMSREEAIALVEYTFSRPVGDPAKEIGAKILTAFSLGVVAGIDLMQAAEADLDKLQRPETIARIRAKRATRHGRGPLLGLDPESLLQSRVGTDTTRFNVQADGKVSWGGGGGAATDTNLERSAAGRLKTDGEMEIIKTLRVGAGALARSSVGAIAIANAATPPIPGAFAGGVILWVDNGALKCIGADGTVTVLAPR